MFGRKTIKHLERKIQDLHEMIEMLQVELDDKNFIIEQLRLDNDIVFGRRDQTLQPPAPTD